MARCVVLACLMSWSAALNARAQAEAPLPTTEPSVAAPQVAPPPAAPPPAAPPAAAPPPVVAPVAKPVIVGEIVPSEKAPGARPLTLTERLLLRQQWMTYREHDRRSIRLAGPVLGLTACLATLGLTSWMLTRDDQQVKATGGVLTGVLVVPLITASIWVLTRRVKKRREIYRELWGAPPVSSLPLGWRF